MKIVLITHYFPPIGGPGARRMLGWVNGFVAAGRDVTVVTPEADPRDPYHQPAERYEGPARVVTPKILDPSRLARKHKKVRETDSAANEQQGLAGKLRPWLLLPDHRRLANGPLLRSARQAIESNGESTLVFTSSPYSSVHLVGRALKQHCGDRVTWVADFRDDWFHSVFFPHPNAAYRAYNRRLERSVLRGADGLTVASRATLGKIRDRQAQHFEDRFWLSEGKAKWRWAPNGFDPTGVQDLLEAPVEQPSAGAPIRLLFSGTLWQGHSIGPLVGALESVARECDRSIRFELVGRVIEPIPTRSEPSQVEIVSSGWRPYRESLAETRQADLLLIHTGPEAQDIKIKVFEAAAVRRPVLVLGPEESVTVQLVKRHVRDPLIADQDDGVTIVRALHKFLESIDRSAHAFDGLPEEYDRLKQANRLLAWAEGLR